MPVAATHPLVEELKRVTVQALHERIQEMFRCADEILLAMSERAETQAEHHAHFETLRLLGMEQPRIARSFARAIARGFEASALIDPKIEPGATLPPRPARPHGGVDEEVTLSHMASRAKVRYRPQLNELEAGLSEQARLGALPNAVRACTPSRFCQAWCAALEGLDLGFMARRILFRLFEQKVLDDLEEVYAELVAVLPRHKASAAPPAGLDGRTLQVLTALGPEQNLRAAILQLASDARAPAAAAAIERLTLVGQMLDTLAADRHLPDTAQPLFERLRLPLIKTAFADAQFFSNPRHPVRRQLQDSLLQLVTARTGDAAAGRLAHQRLGGLAERCRISAEFVLPLLARLTRLGAEPTADFVAQLKVEARERHDALLIAVRKTVAHELALLPTPPAAAQELVRTGLAPLLAMRLLRYGPASKLWQDALVRARQVLRCLDGGHGSDEIMAALMSDLHDAGFEPGRIAALMRNVEPMMAPAPADLRRAA